MDQQNRPQYFQGNSPQSLGEEPMEWEYQADWMGGVPMASTGSNSTMYSSDSRYSIATAATSISGSYTMDSPSRENVQFSPSYQTSFGNLSLGESSSASASYYPPQPSQYASQNERPTPSSIPWDMEVMKVPDFYDFIVEKGKEPCLRLHQRYHSFPSSHLLPQIVYLDRDRHESSKKRHPCLYPGQGCWKSSSRPNFARSADLDRHYNVVHHGSSGEQFPCDYIKCGRHADPFTRKDHCRDHYKEYHKEDIGEVKGCKSSKDRARWEEKQRQWEAERQINTEWWRCPKCLDRVHVKKNGWVCSGCNKECERSRINARTKPVATTVDDKSLVEAGSEYGEPYPGYPYCGTCKDTRTVENTIGGYDNCPSCSSGEYYGEPSYDERPYEYEEPTSSWSQQSRHDGFR